LRVACSRLLLLGVPDRAADAALAVGLGLYGGDRTSAILAT